MIVLLVVVIGRSVAVIVLPVGAIGCLNLAVVRPIDASVALTVVVQVVEEIDCSAAGTVLQAAVIVLQAVVIVLQAVVIVRPAAVIVRSAAVIVRPAAVIVGPAAVIVGPVVVIVRPLVI